MDGAPPLKRRRLRGACDICHKKKIRCDSARMPGNVCSNCVAFGSKCTHTNANKTKHRTSMMSGTGLPLLGGSSRSYEHLPDTYGQDTNQLFDKHAEVRAKVAAILSPRETYGVPDSKVTVRQILVEFARYIQVLEQELLSATRGSGADSPYLFQPSAPPSPLTSSSLSPPAVKDTEEDLLVVDHLKIVTVSNATSRFYGKSSNLLLIKAVLDLREEASGGDPFEIDYARRIRNVGPEYWNGHALKWFSNAEIPLYFPEPDLVDDLIELYFDRFHLFLPVLHKEHFLKSINEGLHLHNKEFGALVLAVCALASRFSVDLRVYNNGAGPKEGVGWQWFSQVQTIIGSFVTVPNLHVIQLFCICILYLQGSAAPGACWMLLGVAVRLIQEVGGHRKVVGESKRSVDSELWRRAFWSVVTIDTYLSAFLGRPRAINMDDCDQELPVECDDEYWTTSDPDMAFQQPPGKPCSMSYWLAHLRLLNILGVAQKTIYAVNKPDLFTTKPLSDQQMVLRIDSALNAWLDSIPDHLRWDPHREDDVFFHQSALLYASYYYVQILVHKPFIPSTKSNRTDIVPSITICATAARSCAHLMDIQSQRGIIPSPTVHIALLSSAVVLMINHLTRRRMPGVSAAQESSDVHKSMNVLKLYESRWRVAGHLFVILENLLKEDPQFQSNSISLTSNEPLYELEKILGYPFSQAGADGDSHPVDGFGREAWHQNQRQIRQNRLQPPLQPPPPPPPPLQPHQNLQQGRRRKRIHETEDEKGTGTENRHQHQHRGDGGNRPSAFDVHAHDSSSVGAFGFVPPGGVGGNVNLNVWSSSSSSSSSSSKGPPAAGWEDWANYLSSVEQLMN